MLIRNTKDGFTMVELMVAIGILTIAVFSMMSLFVSVSGLGEMARNKSLVVSAAQNKIEEIRNHSYSLITTDYAVGGTPGNTFDLTNLTGKGVVYLDVATAPCSAELICVEVDVSWRNKAGRVVGEDTDYDGVIDAGEDVNNNGKLDSPVKLLSMITRR